MLRIVLVALLVSLAGVARAARVHLKSGAVIEGKSTRASGQEMVEDESGQIGLSVDEVDRIVRGASPVQEFEAKREALGPRDIAGRVALANYCRDRGMRGREEQLLREVIELDPDHAEARERLGFVGREGRWVEREQSLRDQGLVPFEGRWLTREQVVEIERLRAQAAIAARQRERAEVELAAAKADLESRKREADAAKRAEEERVTVQPPVAYATPVYPWYWGGHDVSRRHRDRDRDHCPGPRCARKPTTRRTDGRPDWPIAGTKDPFDYLRDSR